MGLTPGAQRILDVASQLFYSRGLTAVGVDTIAAESGVTKRTLYDRFGSKDGLITTYLQVRDRQWRDLVRAGLQATPTGSGGRVLAPFDALPVWLAHNGRGCPFINAFAELPRPAHPGRQVITGNKQWLSDLFVDLLTEAGATHPAPTARQLLSLHDGAIVTHAITGDTEAVPAARSAAQALLALDD